MCDSPQDVYAKCLPSDYGYPLRFPEPSSTLPSSYKQGGLQIGDVGYVDGDGTFNVLFNISFLPTHALNQRLGVSFTFDPIRLDIDSDVDVNFNAIPPDYFIISGGITQRSQRVGHYEFTPSPAKGAILILPDGATSYNLSALVNERFRNLAIKHAFYWYQIIRERCGESVRNGSLYLLTGFYKARSWSLASFRDATGTEDRRISVVPRGECKATGRVWRHTFPLQYRDGPGPGHDGRVNQTVFIRGFRIALRDDVLGWLSPKPEILPVPAISPRKDPCGFARRLMRLFGKKNTSKRHRRENGVADVDRVPNLAQPFHPSDIITQYLLDKDPNALVAVTHDSEWIALIETGELMPEELTRRDRLEAALSKHYSLDSQPENSAVCLSSKSKDVSKSQKIWYNQPSTDDLKVVITSIRAEDVVTGLWRMPVGFYVLVQFDGTKWRTQNKSIDLRNSIVEWNERIQLPSECSAKVRLSVCASFEFDPMLGNGEVLRTAEICVGDLDGNAHLITFRTTEGGSVLPCSSLHITIERRLCHRPGANRDGDFDWEDSSVLAQLTDRGHDALLRYRTDPTKEILAVSIRLFEDALTTCPPGHQCYAAVLCNLARACFINCRIDDAPTKLSTSISCYRKALELRPVGHRDRPATLLHLAEVLLYHYGKLGCEEFPGEITRLASEVQASCSVDSHECRAADLALQTYALYKAIASCSLVNIDQLIPALRRSVQEIPRGYFDRFQSLINLTSALWIRYEFCGDLGDLDESITMHEEALQFTSCGLHSWTYTELLKERAKAASAGGSWKDALIIAASFVVPRLSIYRVLCERLETADRVVEAAECFHAMTNELTQEIQHEEAKWISAFKSCCFGKLEDLGDIAMNAQEYNEAISLYSTALSLDPIAPQGFFIKRSKAHIALGAWKEALSDANEVIMLDPSSPWGYERKYVALHKAGQYDYAIDAYEIMLLKLTKSADPHIRHHWDQYINITTGRPQHMTKVAFGSSPLEEPTNYIVKLDNHYSGRFSDVYKGLYNNRMGRKEVTIIAFRFKFRPDTRSSRMARRELAIWRDLHHANVVPFLGTATGFGVSGITFLISSWMRNGSLESFLEKYDNLEVNHRLRLLLDIANGLHYLHSFTLLSPFSPSPIPNPIFHGDLHPANVLLDDNYTARLVNFGCPSLAGETPEALTYLERSTLQPSTLRWSAPEQISSTSEAVSVPRAESDVYSFGCIALQVLSGKPPWSEVGEDTAVRLQLSMGRTPGRPKSPPIDDQYWELIERCLSQIPNRPMANIIMLSIEQFLESSPHSQPLHDVITSLSCQIVREADPSNSSSSTSLACASDEVTDEVVKSDRHDQRVSE